MVAMASDVVSPGLPELRRRLAAAVAHAARRLWRRSDREGADDVVLDLLVEALDRLGRASRPREGEPARAALAAAPAHVRALLARLEPVAVRPAAVAAAAGEVPVESVAEPPLLFDRGTAKESRSEASADVAGVAVEAAPAVCERGDKHAGLDSLPSSALEYVPLVREIVPKLLVEVPYCLVKSWGLTPDGKTTARDLVLESLEHLLPSEDVLWATVPVVEEAVDILSEEWANEVRPSSCGG